MSERSWDSFNKRVEILLGLGLVIFVACNWMAVVEKHRESTQGATDNENAHVDKQDTLMSIL